MSRSEEARGPVAESYLMLAERARNEAARRRWARAGLRLATHKETSFLLLEQLFRADFRESRYEDAREAARAMVGLAMLTDAAHARAAAAELALGNAEAAEKELRQAAAVAPGQRRAFHLWSLGAFLHMQGRLAEALAAFTRSERIDARPLTRAHAAVVRCALGEPPAHLAQIAEELEVDPGHEGYGAFLLGLIYAELGDAARSRRELQEFLRRSAEDPLERGVTRRSARAMARARLGPARARPERSEVARGRVIPLRTARRAR